ncbi:MAG: ferritin family protein [Bacteroidales bacterium]|nr:ferritin family protein [Bacteroidales bacterium]
MKDFKNTDEILDFAIQNEQQAADFYDKLASESKQKSMQNTFLQFAKEEKGHKARLLKIKEEGIYEAPEAAVLDMKISDYLVSVSTSENMTYQEALILAMKREKAAFRLYMKLADITTNEDLKKIFINLANEEAKHKMNFELEYDDVVYKEN